MLACVVIGLWAMGRTKTTSDFFMAGRNLGVALTGIAMFSSIMSGFGFVGGPGLVYRMGLSSFWISGLDADRLLHGVLSAGEAVAVAGGVA